MNYQDTVHWMFSQLPMYQNKGKSAYKSDLSNTILLSNYLNNPDRSFKSVHVAGTNGKGSTSHMMSSILQEAGYKVGLYTSPHLKDFRERIKLNGHCISKKAVIEFIKAHRSFFEEQKLSFFEMTVGLAFDYFKKKKVDIAIIEVGLGGRLDSTNIINPELSIITNIGLDHTQYLGTTKSDIAKEKGGIIKLKTSVIIGETQKKLQQIFIDLAQKKRSEIIFADQVKWSSYHNSDLKGNYQRSNVKTAVTAIKVLNNKGFKVTKSHIKKGLLNVVKNTGLLGRWQILQLHPKIICDTAHNKEGLTFIMQQLSDEQFENIHFVLGFVNDKDLEEIIDLFPKEGRYYFCKPNVERGLDSKKLKANFANRNYNGNAFESTLDAFESAKKNAKKNDLIFVGGSTFVVAEIL